MTPRGDAVLAVHVVGTPKPQGSKRGFVVPGKAGGKARAVVVDTAKAPLKDWRGAVTVKVQNEIIRARAAESGLDPEVDTIAWEPLRGPLAVRLVFALPRPASAPKTRRVWPSGRVGDVDKLARSVLDSLTDAGVWHDDAQVVDLQVVKDYPGPDIGQHVPGVRITVWRVVDTASASALPLEGDPR